MKRGTRIHYTDEQKAMMWNRWQKGETLDSIARHFDRHQPSIERIYKGQLYHVAFYQNIISI